ncbi:hypothetical protein [Jannaschia sp. CCS1]|uniref:hypothetical protein n=1 Tax=Jannaschia sp. (strain CCS1) TaxID=290400 RepID=UPI000053AA83|nr:hypothetical protein [Jannaschia sp. CCS1]
MMARLVQIALAASAAALSYWGWIELNTLRGTPFFEYRYVILLSAAILLFSVAQAIAGWIDRRLNPDDH